MCFGEKIRRDRTKEYAHTYTGGTARTRRAAQRRPVNEWISTPALFGGDSTEEDESDRIEDPDYMEAESGGNREKYMGSTPSKFSAVGSKVIQNMLEQHIVDDGTWLDKDNFGKIYLQTNYAPGRKFYLDDSRDAKLLHMGHLYDAVKFWNEIGRYTGPKSDCVLAFMHDANNYLIQYGPRNCQMAPHETYLPPMPPYIDLPYESCQTVGDKSNFASMKRKIR